MEESHNIKPDQKIIYSKWLSSCKIKKKEAG